MFSLISVNDEIFHSYPFEYLPVEKTEILKKPITVFITGEGMLKHLKGNPIGSEDVILPQDLWATDPRLGIGLDSDSRTATEHMIYTTDTVALKDDVSFYAEFLGADEFLPTDGLLRLGGDGRGAKVQKTPTFQ